MTTKRLIQPDTVCTNLPSLARNIELDISRRNSAYKIKPTVYNEGMKKSQVVLLRSFEPRPCLL